MMVWVPASSAHDMVKFKPSTGPELPPPADSTADGLLGVNSQHPPRSFLLFAHPPIVTVMSSLRIFTF
jgi:hypothetical protein